jgi:hypothetical protein
MSPDNHVNTGGGQIGGESLLLIRRTAVML